MESSKEYPEFILDQLSGPDDIKMKETAQIERITGRCHETKDSKRNPDR